MDSHLVQKFEFGKIVQRKAVNYACTQTMPPTHKVTVHVS